ncbi:MAG TPA: hypothetical protein ACFCUC_08985, partial [Desulfobacterales bacterium]
MRRSISELICQVVFFSNSTEELVIPDPLSICRIGNSELRHSQNNCIYYSNLYHGTVFAWLMKKNMLARQNRIRAKRWHPENEFRSVGSWARRYG